MGAYREPATFPQIVRGLHQRIDALERRAPFSPITGDPTDTPPDGHVRLRTDTTPNRVYWRSEGAWKYVELT